LHILRGFKITACNAKWQTGQISFLNTLLLIVKAISSDSNRFCRQADVAKEIPFKSGQ
jgi:hypothetical protein